MPRRLLKSRSVLPAAVLVAVALGTVLSLAGSSGASSKAHGTPGTVVTGATPTTVVPRTGKKPVHTAGATIFVNTKPKVTPTAPACTQAAATIGYVAPPNSGSPQNSTTLTCSNGHVVSYGSSGITYKLPPSSYVAAGHKLFEENCSSCHLSTAQGSAVAPSLHGVGPAAVDFWVTTGRMPAATPLQVQADEKPPRLTDRQAQEVAAWVNSLSPAAPYIPYVNEKKANLSDGANLFALDCAACHTITGAGDALAYGTFAVTLHNPTSQQVAEAVRTGPGNMPRFTGNLTDSQVRDVVAYVTQKIEHPDDRGGFGLGGVGPVAEGFVALLFGVGGLMLVAFWIGDRSS